MQYKFLRPCCAEHLSAVRALPFTARMEPPQEHIARRTTTHVNAQGQFIKRLPSTYQLQASGTTRVAAGGHAQRSATSASSTRSDELPKMKEQDDVSVVQRSGSRSTPSLQHAESAPPDVSPTMTSRSGNSTPDLVVLPEKPKQPSGLGTMHSLPLQLQHIDTNGEGGNHGTESMTKRTDTTVLLEKKTMAEVADVLHEMYIQHRTS